jgi:hypothetical protein
MVVPDIAIYKINPDCQGTHIIQSEMDELVKKYEFATDVCDEQRKWISKDVDFLLNSPCVCDYGDCKYCLDADDLLETSGMKNK